MNLKEKIENDLTYALKEKDTLKLSVLRLIKNAIKNFEIERRTELKEDEVIQVLEKQAKQRRDSIEQYKNALREDLANKEKDELTIIEGYLPEKLSEEEIKKIIDEIYLSLSDEVKNNFGKLMGASMKELKGKADPSLVTKIVKEKLGA